MTTPSAPPVHVEYVWAGPSAYYDSPMNQWRVGGLRVEINNQYRFGTVQVNSWQALLSMSEATLSTLVHEAESGGQHPLLSYLGTEVTANMKAVMVDLAKSGFPVKDKRRTLPSSSDIVIVVEQGIVALTQQMASFSQGRPATEAQVANFAQRYTELVSKMKLLREMVDHAEGMFEVAQVQIMKILQSEA